MISLFDEYAIMAMPGDERRAILARVYKSPLMLACMYVSMFSMLVFTVSGMAAMFGGSPRSPVGTAARIFFHISLALVFLCRTVLFRGHLDPQVWDANAAISPKDTFALNRFPLTVPGALCVLYGLWFMISVLAMSVRSASSSSPPGPSFLGMIAFMLALCMLLSGRGYFAVLQDVLKSRHARGRCPRCRYPLDGAALCTECGLRIEAS